MESDFGKELLYPLHRYFPLAATLRTDYDGYEGSTVVTIAMKTARLPSKEAGYLLAASLLMSNLVPQLGKLLDTAPHGQRKEYTDTAILDMTVKLLKLLDAYDDPT